MTEPNGKANCIDPMLASLVILLALPRPSHPILWAVKVVSLRDLHHAQTFRVVARTAPWAPGAVNPSAMLRGRCCASTISALPRSVPLVGTAARHAASVLHPAL